MNGGPSQMDLFDPKPMLDKHHGEPYFDNLAADLTGPENAGGLLRSPFQFKQHGKSGTWVSELMPHLAQQVDNIAVIRSMFTTHPNHEPASFHDPFWKDASGSCVSGRLGRVWTRQ
jgi:hypothetical protein